MVARSVTHCLFSCQKPFGLWTWIKEPAGVGLVYQAAVQQRSEPAFNTG